MSAPHLAGAALCPAGSADPGPRGLGLRPGLAAERRPQGRSFKPRGLPFLLFPEPRGGALFARFEVKSPRAWDGGPRGSREPGRRGSTAHTSAAAPARPPPPRGRGPGASSGLGTPPRSRNTRTIRGGRTGRPRTDCGRAPRSCSGPAAFQPPAPARALLHAPCARWGGARGPVGTPRTRLGSQRSRRQLWRLSRSAERRDAGCWGRARLGWAERE